MDEHVATFFETSFLSESLEKQMKECDRYELAPLFISLFGDHTPVLEAGCGSGRWCGWLAQHGIPCDGIDWSAELCARASRELPVSRFLACDMRCVPLPDHSYGGILALGSVEHSSDGPLPALREFRRLIRQDGIAIITVPYRGWLRGAARTLGYPHTKLRASRVLRRLLGKSCGGRTLREARRGTNRVWHPRFQYGRDGWSFYEYEFNKNQMRELIALAGFTAREQFVAFADEGILHTFGRVVGKWSREQGAVDLGPLGRVAKRLLPTASSGHMLCTIAEPEK